MDLNCQNCLVIPNFGAHSEVLTPLDRKKGNPQANYQQLCCKAQLESLHRIPFRIAGSSLNKVDRQACQIHHYEGG